MNKFIKHFLPFAAISLVLIGCNDNDSSKVTGVFSGYTADSDGNQVSLRVYANGKSAISEVLDYDDNQSISKASKYTETSVTFNDFNCSVANKSLVCNDNVLESLALSAITLSSLDGTFQKVDGSQKTWTMTIASGNVTISNDTDACKLNGNVVLSLENTVPYFTLSTVGCSVTGTFKAFAEIDTVANENDTLNMLIPDFSDIASNWTK